MLTIAWKRFHTKITCAKRTAKGTRNTAQTAMLDLDSVEFDAKNENQNTAIPIAVSQKCNSMAPRLKGNIQSE